MYFDDMCGISQRSFWSWFDVNRSTFSRRYAQNDFHVCFFSDVDLRPFDLKFALPFSLVQDDISTKLEMSTAFQFRVNRRQVTTDRRTDGQGATLYATSYGGSHKLNVLEVGVLCDIVGH